MTNCDIGIDAYDLWHNKMMEEEEEIECEKCGGGIRDWYYSYEGYQKLCEHCMEEMLDDLKGMCIRYV